MSGRFEGKVALVTGGARGIGEAVARRFVSEGGRCVIVDIDVAEAEAVAVELGSSTRAVYADVSVESDVSAAVDETVSAFGQLDLMFNNAGIEGVLGSVASLSLSGWDATLGVLLSSVVLGTKHAARVMVPRRSGVIVNTASVAGLYAGLAPHAYTTAKAAVVALTESTSAELYDHGVRVVAIAPGAVVTRLIGSGDRNDLEGTRRKKEMESPFGHAPMPADVAAVVAFLASDEAWLINGTCVPLDAGIMIRSRRTPSAQ